MDRAPDLTVEELAVRLPAEAALLGLDVGTRTIGVAVSDPLRRVATALVTIHRRRFADDAAQLLGLAADRGVAAMEAASADGWTRW